MKFPGGVPVTGYISPTDTTDHYATHFASFGKGGYRSVIDINERDSIDASRREDGMLVYVLLEKKEYRLSGGIENTNWIYEPISAYDIAVKNGFTGTITQWLASLKGQDGLSAFEEAVVKGYSGNETQWLNSLKGLQGTDGLSAYQLAVKNGYTGTETEWVNKLNSIMTSDQLLSLIDSNSMNELEVNNIINSKLGNYLPLSGGKMSGAITGTKETQVALGTSNNIDLTLGNVFTKIMTVAGTLTISNPAAVGTVNSFILELTNGGNFAPTFWTGVKWANGVLPAFTTGGTDILGFYSYDNGRTWRGILLSRDSK